MVNKLKKILLFIFLFFICFSVKAIEIDSRNAVLINLNTDSIVYEKNKDEKVSIASLQKILTSIVAIENIEDLNEKIVFDKSKVSSIASDVYTLGIKDKEEVTYYDLLEATMLKSAGDAALYLALSVSDTEEDFAKLVNDKAKEIGLENTVYKDPIGLEREGQFSTANDVSKVLEYALNNEEFKKIFTTSSYTFNEYELNGPRSIAKDLGSSYVKGAKTGYTSKAGNCLASYIKNDKEEFILVTLNNSKRNSYFDDTKLLMDYYIKNYSVQRVLNKNDKITTVKSSFGESIDIKSDKNIDLYIKKDAKVEYKYEGKNKVTLKNKNGDMLGKYYILVDGESIYEKDIYLDKKISFYIPTKIKYILIGIFSLIVIVFIIRKAKK